ncbi:hypothetical protein AC578_6070 [Pseudocercospora eumusae]|uniref:Uncharacterized protein n=1 Tax=Pseudocercospora eumusae TaxID=321146 RepID=A0A139HVK1_9PEZI|nr:hypothetical protein AC578_6070 [Pseudocercospora eumusae]
MPTPSEDNIIDSTVVSFDEELRRCPPEEARERRTQRQERLVETTDLSSAGADHSEEQRENLSRPEHIPTSNDAPQSDARGSVNNRLQPPRRHTKVNEVDDAGILPEPPSPTVGSPDAPSDSDVRLAQSMSSTAISPESNAPPSLYLHYAELDRERYIGPNSTTSYLRPGSKFRGTQQSDRQVYDVQVELKDVDMEESRLCGYLRIQGLTDDHPTLTTFFEGEIIGPRYLFRTSHPTWGSSEKVDLQHWARFPAWRPLAKSATKNPLFTLKNPWEKEHLFMRWKEYFLVPDHRVRQISGASFEGFYYICFDQRSGGVSGIYFHSKSEKYQQLELRWVDDGGRVPAVEFR